MENYFHSFLPLFIKFSFSSCESENLFLISSLFDSNFKLFIRSLVRMVPKVLVKYQWRAKGKSLVNYNSIKIAAGPL